MCVCVCMWGAMIFVTWLKTEMGKTQNSYLRRVEAFHCRGGKSLQGTTVEGVMDKVQSLPPQ